MGGRDDKGRFLPGHGLKGGRKPRATEERFLELLKEAVTEADWKGVVRKTVALAKKGDARARTWLSDYLMGRPTEKTSGALGVYSIDFTKLTDEQLDRIANGEDPLAVLATSETGAGAPGA